MASTYSALKIELIGTGDQAGTWGATTNTNLGTALEEAITGSANVTFANSNVALTLTDTNASQTARNLRLFLTGTVSQARHLFLPAIEKQYIIDNGLTFPITVANGSNSGATGATITVPAGLSAIIFNDGVNMDNPVSYTPLLGNVTINGGTANALTLTNTTISSVTTPLTVSQGGTGVATLTGVLKGNGTNSVATAIAGTDYVDINTPSTFTALQTFNGNTSAMSSKFLNAKEGCTISATPANATINYDITTQSVLYYTSNATGNFTVNFRASSGTTLNATMSNGESATVTFLATQGGTAYYNSNVQVDGTTTNVSTRWQGGTAPTSGSASAIDAYTYTIIKTNNAAFTVLASQTKFA